MISLAQGGSDTLSYGATLVAAGVIVTVSLLVTGLVVARRPVTDGPSGEDDRSRGPHPATAA